MHRRQSPNEVEPLFIHKVETDSARDCDKIILRCICDSMVGHGRHQGHMFPSRGYIWYMPFRNLQRDTFA